jgi:hypothetical protein
MFSTHHQEEMGLEASSSTLGELAKNKNSHYDCSY